MADPVTMSWLFAAKAGFGDLDSSMDTTAFLDSEADKNLVIVSIGAAASGNDITMIELGLAPLQSDGTLGKVEKRKFGNTSVSATYTATAAATPPHVAVGFGLGISGGAVKTVKLHTRQLDSTSGLLESKRITYTSGTDTSNGPNYMEWYISPAAVNESDVASTVLTGVAARVTSKNNAIDAIAVQLGTLQIFTPSLATAPPPMPPRHVRSINAQNVAPILNAAFIADEAYRSVENDGFFSKGYRRIDGTVVHYANKQDWLIKNNYTLIVNPSGGSNTEKYWGIATVHNSNVVVAFRGTMTLDDIAIDTSGFEIQFTGNGIVPKSAVFKVKTVGNGITTMQVHQGFYDTYETIAPSVQTTVSDLLEQNPGYGLVLVGHSLGGGLAAMCALDLSDELTLPLPTVITLGAPKVGDQAFIDEYVTCVEHSYDVVQFQDPIPWIPWSGTASDGSSVNMMNIPATQILASDYWFPTAHSLARYYTTLVRTLPSTISQDLDPRAVITDITVTIHTGNVWGAGTNNLVTVSILGQEFGPLGNDSSFERDNLDTFDLYKSASQRLPENTTVEDLYGTLFGIWLDNSATGITSPWFLDYIAIKINDTDFTTLQFRQWLDPRGKKPTATWKRIGGD